MQSMFWAAAEKQLGTVVIAARDGDLAEVTRLWHAEGPPVPRESLPSRALHSSTVFSHNLNNIAWDESEGLQLVNYTTDTSRHKPS